METSDWLPDVRTKCGENDWSTGANGVKQTSTANNQGLEKSWESLVVSH